MFSCYVIKTMANKDNREFKYALREICVKAPNLDCPYDRVRCSQWVKKLSQIPSENLEIARLRNEYIQLLRIQVRNKYLHGIFKESPPETDQIAPLAEVLGNNIAKQIPQLPRVGPIAPILQHRSPDGRAYVAAKQIPGGVFCYLAVTPNILNFE